MKDWTTEEAFELINAYKSQSLLWDKSHSLYKNSEKRAESYKKIASKFKNCTEMDVKEKLRNLRTIFMERLRKVKHNRVSKVQPKWQFFTALEFLIKDANTSTIIELTASEEPPVKRKTDCFSPTEISSHTSNSDTHVPLIKLKPKRKTTKHDAGRLGSERSAIPEITTGSLNEATVQNHAQFGAFVASSMDSMSDPDLEKLAEIKIRMILAELCQEAAKRQLEKYKSRPFSI